MPDLEMAREFARRAKEDLRSSKVLLENGLYADSVYHAQQAAEKIVKSILLLNDIIVAEHLVASHFVSAIVSKSPDEWSEKLLDIAKDLIDLEKEWLRSRYPMRKFGKLVIPSSLYDLKKAEELYEKARTILETVLAYAEEVCGVKLID
ncbi:MAG: HEPN domain-containing protein [Candidatus Methanodesulfokora washburnensis]